MKTKQILLATAATILLSTPVMAAEMGDMTGRAGVSGTTKAMPNATSNAPATGPNSTAIPEVPATGATSTSSSTTVGNSGEGTTGTSGKDGGSSSNDLQHQLTTKGYTSITPTGSAGATSSGETRFNATNAAGKKVLVTVNANTGAIVKETPAE